MTPIPKNRPRSHRRASPVHRRRRAGLVLLISAVWMFVTSTHSPAATSTSYEAVATLPEVVGNITAWVVSILAGVATMFLTIGGLRYAMAGGDPGEVEKAKSALKSALIGYALAMLAPVLVSVMQGLVGAK